MRRRIQILFLYCALSLRFIAQDRTIDSLKEFIARSENDTMVCLALTHLIAIEPDDKVWPAYNDQLRKRAESFLKNCNSTHHLKRFYSEILADCINNVAYVEENKGDIIQAIEHYNKALKINREVGNRKGESANLFALGLVYRNLRDYSRALQYLNSSLSVCQSSGNTQLLSNVYNCLGVIYKDKNDSKKALEYYNKSKEYAEKQNDLPMLAYIFMNTGVVYFTYGDPSIRENKESLQKGMKMGLDLLNKGIKLFEEVGDKKGLSFCLHSLSTALKKKGDFKGAIDAGERSLKVARETGFPDNIKYASHSLSQLYSESGNYEKAFRMQVLYKEMSDSINNDNNRKASIQKAFQYEYEKKAAADSIKVVEERKLHHAQMQEEKIIRLALYTGLVLVLIFSVFIFNRFRVTRRQKVIIENQKSAVDHAYELLNEKNKEVLDSIKYAQRIQRALITNEKHLEAQLKRTRKL